jgi:diaminopimelate decarboxylase
MSFHTRDGYLYCEGLRVKDILARAAASPFYLYSLAAMTASYNAYASALAETRSPVRAVIAYALKANSNLALLKHLRQLGAGAVLVSENELRLALAAGFDPKQTIFNGNGKTPREIALAIEYGVLINIDSEFDLAHIEQASRGAKTSVDVLLRINPDMDPEVHPYVSTGMRSSKFGVRGEEIPQFLDRIRSARSLNLVGVHCHLGSTIKDIAVYRDAARLMAQLAGRIRSEGFPVRYMNMGGGLGIDYDGSGAVPGTAELIDAFRRSVPADFTLILEPGRSIVAGSGVLVCRVIGVKTNGRKRFIVVDGSMAELIRPSLYGAYHRIGFVEPISGRKRRFDVVGPVCESADFLGKNRALATPAEGTGVVVFDAGAYGYAMSSNYNARMRPAEYLVDGEDLREIRRAETFADYTRLFESSGTV